VTTLSAGAQLPAVEFTDDAGARVTHAELGRGRFVLFFYPKDDTPGCTREACAFSDQLADFAALGVGVYGVSADGEESHRAFRARHGLTVRLLSDPTHAACEAFGVWGTQRYGAHVYEGIARTTFVLRDGVVDRVFGEVEVDGHVALLLAYLRAG
jgi:peroxiredoxin Q/BCP